MNKDEVEQAQQEIEVELRKQMHAKYTIAIREAIFEFTGIHLADGEMRKRGVFLVKDDNTKIFVFDGKELLLFGIPVIKTRVLKNGETEISAKFPCEKLWEGAK